jgi:cell division protein FtsW
MLSISRSSDNIVSKWWWTDDRPLLFSFVLMIVIGVFLAMAATPMVANHIGIDQFHFLKRHLLFIVPSLLVIFVISNMSYTNIRKFALLLFFAALFLTLLTLFFGSEIKGARRWISFLGLSIQPSEFCKPALTILVAWMFSEEHNNSQVNGRAIGAFLYFLVAFLLVLQPDVGMLFVTTAVFGIQLFLNGLPLFFVFASIFAGISGLGLAYLFLPHVTVRVNKFLDPAAGDHYQINRSLEAFSRGGLFGVGPGEGIVKKHLPDAHADFVFSVLGEEFGFFVCVSVVILIGFIVLYGMNRALKEHNMFALLSSVGLLSQFGLQSFINMASSLHLIPTKGMTLPFMSYGGSSMLAISIVVGLILAFNRRRSFEDE